MKRMKLRYAGACRTCTIAIPAGTTGFWDTSTKTVSCEACVAGAEHTSSPTPPTAQAAPTATQTKASKAGASARDEYDKRAARREERIRAKHPIMGGLILAVGEEPQHQKAWKVGAEGERRVAQRLAKLGAEGILALHDLAAPGSKANIDHIAFTASGIHVIDAKRYTGKVEIRSSGFFSNDPPKLFVGGRNQTKLVTAMDWQVDVLRKVLIGTPFAGATIVPVLAFSGAEFPLFQLRPKAIGDVQICDLDMMMGLLRRDGPVTPDRCREAHDLVAERLRPASR